MGNSKGWVKNKVDFKVPRYTITLFLFVELLNHIVIVPDEIHESYPGKSICCKSPKFWARSSEQTVQTYICLLLRNQSD